MRDHRLVEHGRDRVEQADRLAPADEPPRVVELDDHARHAGANAEPHTIGFLTGIRTSQRRIEAIARSSALAETAVSGTVRASLGVHGGNLL
jgi:hypothetical protein